MTKRRAPAGARIIGVKQVATNALHPNPHNPRFLFDRKPLEVLKESIKRVGILVPLTIYWDAKRKRFYILDGQRRWQCATEIGLKKVPVHQVTEPSLVQNIVTMFQIHKFREDWELMPTALKIELLMKETGERNEPRLAEMTGLDVAVVIRCKKLISYDKEFQDMMLDPDPAKRMKADFFIELYPVIHDREVQKFQWFSVKKFIREMIKKYLEEPRTIKAVTDFRLIKQYIANARRSGVITAFSKRLETFAKDHSTPLQYLEIEEASVHAEAKSIVKKIISLEAAIASLDTEQFYGEEDLWDWMSRLIKIFEKKLREADKRR